MLPPAFTEAPVIANEVVASAAVDQPLALLPFIFTSLPEAKVISSPELYVVQFDPSMQYDILGREPVVTSEILASLSVEVLVIIKPEYSLKTAVILVEKEVNLLASPSPLPMVISVPLSVRTHLSNMNPASGIAFIVFTVSSARLIVRDFREASRLSLSSARNSNVPCASISPPSVFVISTLIGLTFHLTGMALSPYVFVKLSGHTNVPMF